MPNWTMTDWGPYPAILAVGLAAYAMRAGGFLVMGALPQGGLVARLLRLAPGNLFIAFVAAGVLAGGWPNLVGCVAAMAAMAVTGKEWAALAAGFAAAALAAMML